MQLCMYVCKCICTIHVYNMHVYMHVYIHMYACVYVCIYACVYVCMYMYLCVCVFACMYLKFYSILDDLTANFAYMYAVYFCLTVQFLLFLSLPSLCVRESLMGASGLLHVKFIIFIAARFASSSLWLRQ